MLVRIFSTCIHIYPFDTLHRRVYAISIVFFPYILLTPLTT